MNKKVITKCLAELEKPDPDISYVRGMLETMLDIVDTNPYILPGTTSVPHLPTPITNSITTNESPVTMKTLETTINKSKIQEMEDMMKA